METLSWDLILRVGAVVVILRAGVEVASGVLYCRKQLHYFRERTHVREMEVIRTQIELEKAKDKPCPPS